MKEILELNDIRLLVDNFYSKVREDELLGPVFNNRIGNRWPEHLEKMYKFWQTVLLQEHTYFGSPFPPHAQLPVDGQHFTRWVQLFQETIGENFTGELAAEAKWRAGKMAALFQSKIEYLRKNPSNTLL